MANKRTLAQAVTDIPESRRLEVCEAVGVAAEARAQGDHTRKSSDRAQ